jgi:hypothetical protein
MPTGARSRQHPRPKPPAGSTSAGWKTRSAPEPGLDTSCLVRRFQAPKTLATIAGGRAQPATGQREHPSRQSPLRPLKPSAPRLPGQRSFPPQADLPAARHLLAIDHARHRRHGSPARGPPRASRTREAACWPLCITEVPIAQYPGGALQKKHPERNDPYLVQCSAIECDRCLLSFSFEIAAICRAR